MKKGDPLLEKQPTTALRGRASNRRLLTTLMLLAGSAIFGKCSDSS
jgi:hypothetical protein